MTKVSRLKVAVQNATRRMSVSSRQSTCTVLLTGASSAYIRCAWFSAVKRTYSMMYVRSASGLWLCAVERSITSSFYGFKNYSVFRIYRIILFGFIFMALRISSTEVPERSIFIQINGTYILL